ncbi:MAG: DUF2721 domain-containing protein [Ignavibacteriae bacterium]|nr:DUF2721 domain-containing protein [Ignavibacteriota bacterium]
METTITAIQAIQAILAPALGISAVGLLLLGLNNRYSLIISRIRQLNDEKRRFTQRLLEKTELSYMENSRFMSIRQQSEELFARSKIVRNAILSLQTSIGLFVLSSVAIGLSMVIEAEVFRLVPLFLFILGMIVVFIGILYAALDVYRAYHIVLLEMRAEE